MNAVWSWKTFLITVFYVYCYLSRRDRSCVGAMAVSTNRRMRHVFKNLELASPHPRQRHRGHAVERVTSLLETRRKSKWSFCERAGHDFDGRRCFYYKIDGPGTGSRR